MRDKDYEDYHCWGKILSHFKTFSDSCLNSTKWICLVIFIFSVISFLIQIHYYNENLSISSNYTNHNCDGNNCSSYESESSSIKEEDSKTILIVGLYVSFFFITISICIGCLIKNVLKSRVSVGIEDKEDQHGNKVSASHYW